MAAVGRPVLRSPLATVLVDLLGAASSRIWARSALSLMALLVMEVLVGLAR